MISLLDVLPKELIILDFHAKDKNDVLVQIADLFHEKNMVHDRDVFYEHLCAREGGSLELGTALENGVAVPHVAAEMDRDIVVAIFISQAAVDFKAIDGKPTHIFVGMACRHEIYNGGKNNIYLHYLALITSLLKDKDFRDELMKAKSVEGVISSIKQHEENIRERQRQNNGMPDYLRGNNK